LRINGYENDDAVGGFTERFFQHPFGKYIYSNVHACFSRIDNLSFYTDYGSNLYGLIKADSTDINRYTIVSGPIACTGIGGLVDPLHHRPSMYLPSKVYI